MQSSQATPGEYARRVAGGLRVLRVLPTLGTGGTEKQCLEIIAAVQQLQPAELTQPELQIDLATIYQPQSEQQLPLPITSRHHALNESRSSLGLLRAGRRLARLLSDYDLVHALLWPSTYAVALARPRIPFIASLHGSALAAGPLGIKHLLDRLAFRRAQCVVFNSQAGANALSDYLGLRHAQTAVVENGKALYSGPELPRSGVLCLARAQAPKRQILLLDALQLMPDTSRPHVSFIGQQTTDAALRSAVEQRQLGQFVSLIGEVADAMPYLSRAEILALPSDHEGLPNAILEAWSAGAAVIASNVAGIRELVHDGRDGLLVENTPQAWRDGLAALVNSPELCNRLAAAGKVRVEQQFSLSAAAQAWSRLYLQATRDGR